MKVAVIGPGAMGCLYAAKIARGGIDTVLVDHRSDRAARLTAKGIRIEAPEGEYTTEIKAVSSVPANVDLAIVLVKSGSTSSLSLNG
ncbi:MAG: 2-dehydropantoate 2-reductase N-terminal domain-containing protein, partial [Candidatus Hydrogenedentales bacterium]